MNTTNTKSPMPKDWLSGLKENLKADLSAGFVVFLLALPLSLGIAKAADVPPLMGIITAIIGGILVTFITGSKLTIKGPAAGLIVIIAGAVEAFGGGEMGWKMAAGCMVVAGILQILFGLLKLGKLVDFFPLAAIHGMLAAIGLIIIAKQLPVLLNVNPTVYSGHSPIGLFAMIPSLIQNMNPNVAIIGIGSLLIMLFWNKIPSKILKSVPAPLVVLLFSIPLGIYLNLASGPEYTLVKVGNLLDSVAFNANFSGISQIGIFIKFTIMFALVGSLESLLTVKAIDIMDPHKRWSNPDQDLIAVGVGNTLAAILGGIPMISEVARSSANVASGAQTRWANFFHGLFLLIFVALAYPVLEMIPNAALAGMLIAVGINLAHPKEFIENYRLGIEQLIIFLVTIMITLVEDLLLGILAGILVKFLFHIARGVSIKKLFSTSINTTQIGDAYNLEISDSAIFSNYIKLKSQLDRIPDNKNLTIIFNNTVRLVDHSVMDNIEHFKEDYEQTGGKVEIIGLELLEPVGNHRLSARVSKKSN